MKTALRTALALVLLLPAGAVVAVCAVVLSSWWWGVGLGVATAVACAVALPPGWRGRLPFGLGFAVVVARLSLRRPEGDYLVVSGPGGYVLLTTGLALVVAALVAVPPRRSGAGP